MFLNNRLGIGGLERKAASVLSMFGEGLNARLGIGGFEHIGVKTALNHLFLGFNARLGIGEFERLSRCNLRDLPSVLIPVLASGDLNHPVRSWTWTPHNFNARLGIIGFV